jgi:hypothetical protein
MLKTNHLRVCVSAPGAMPTFFEDGTLIVSCLNDSSRAAALLCIDMSLWTPHGGAPVDRIVGQASRIGYRRLLSHELVSVESVRVVQMDAQGAFDFFQIIEDGGDAVHLPVVALSGGVRPRSREAFLSWFGGMGASMLELANEVSSGALAAVGG